MTNKSLLCERNSIRRLSYISRNHQHITTIYDWVGHPGRRVSTLSICPRGPHSIRFKELTVQMSPPQRAYTWNAQPQRLLGDSPATPQRLPIDYPFKPFPWLDSEIIYLSPVNSKVQHYYSPLFPLDSLILQLRSLSY